MKLVRLKKTDKKVTKKADGYNEDFKAGMQLKTAAIKALEKARESFKKVMQSKESPDYAIADAERQFRFVERALEQL